MGEGKRGWRPPFLMKKQGRLAFFKKIKFSMKFHMSIVALSGGKVNFVGFLAWVWAK